MHARLLTLSLGHLLIGGRSTGEDSLPPYGRLPHQPIVCSIWCLGSYRLSTMGILDEDEVLVLRKLQEIREKKAISLEESHNQLHREVTDLQNVVACLQTENQRLKNELETIHTQLEDEATLFQTILFQWFDDKSRKVFDLERTMETIFQDLLDDYGTKTNLVDDLEKEVKTLSHTENIVLKTNICRLEESNTQLANEVAHLQTFVDELREEVAPL